MLKWSCGLGLVIAASVSLAGDAGPNYAAMKFETDIQPMLTKYCLGCHGDVKPKGGIRFSPYKDLASIQKAPGVWGEVLSAIRLNEMPPSSAEDKLTTPEREKLVGWINWAMETIDLTKLPKNPGHIVLHRLSREEYNNTIRDLLGVTTRHADKFPADGGGGGGFDNNADTLYIPPLLLEKLVEAAKEIVEEAKPDRIFTTKPADATPAKKKEAAKEILTGLMTKAYRRPLKFGDMERILNIFEGLDKKGVAFEDAVKHSLKAVLCSPHFLFRVEMQKILPDPQPLEHYEMASRLSYFLWSSMPDDELFKLAAAKQLQDPKVLEAQALRMLKDPKARALGDNFARQWLGIDALENGLVAPDAKRFPEFTPELKDAMLGEVSAFTTHILRENESLLNLIDSKYTFANEALSKHYGLASVKGPAFQKVALTDDKRGGVLGFGAVHATSSYALRTSPVLRGKWILEHVIGAPPPPPPPDTPTLPQEEPAKGQLSLREQLEKHRLDAKCASCHDRIDPLGFSLENYDVIGRWRTVDAQGKPLDTAGVLPTGEKVGGPAELKKVLLGRKAEFLKNFTEKLMSYALGRGVEIYDRLTIKDIQTALAKDQYRAQTLVLEIVKSYPFRYKQNLVVENKP